MHVLSNENILWYWILAHLVFTQPPATRSTHHPGVQLLLHSHHRKMSISSTDLTRTATTFKNIQFLRSGLSSSPHVNFTASRCHHCNWRLIYCAWPGREKGLDETWYQLGISTRGCCAFQSALTWSVCWTCSVGKPLLPFLCGETRAKNYPAKRTTGKRT